MEWQLCHGMSENSRYVTREKNERKQTENVQENKRKFGDRKG